MEIVRYQDSISIDFFPGASQQENLHEYALPYYTLCSRRQLQISLLCKPAYVPKRRRRNPAPATKPRAVAILIEEDATNDELAEIAELYWYVLPEGARNTRVMAPIEEWECTQGERIVASVRHTRPHAINDLLSEVDRARPEHTASELAVMDPADFSAHEIEPHVYTMAKLTLLLAADEEPFVMDLYLKPPGTGLPEYVVYGKGWHSKELLNSKLAKAFDRRGTGGVLVLRSFLKEVEADNSTPPEEMRAWDLQPHADPEDWRMSPEEARHYLSAGSRSPYLPQPGPGTTFR